MLQCGPIFENQNRSCKLLLGFLLEHFPILSYRVKNSPVTLLVDGLNPPDSVLRAYFECHDPGSISHTISRKQEVSNKQAQATFIKSLHKLHDRLEYLSNAEFATEELQELREERVLEFSSLEKGASQSKSSKLKEFPSLVNLIGKILWDHGDERAQKKREDEDAHTVGLGVGKIAEILYTQYNIDVSPSTVWRMGTSKRQRTVRHGGRYGLIKYQKVGVRNSQLHKPHCRGQYLASNVRGLKEFLTYHHKKGMRVCFAGIDDMSLTPVLGDAVDHRSSHASNRGCTLEGDTHNNIDHNFGYFDAQGRSMKVRTTGIVFCYLDEKDNLDTVKDKYGRDHLPRPRVKEMFVFNRDNHFEHGDATMSHWRDIKTAFEQTYPQQEQQPEIFCVISDNGSGYDPVCPRNQHYAKVFMDDHPGIKLLILMSFAAGESARNFEIERSWAAFTKALIGQQLGACCLNSILRGPDGTLRGPRDNTERKAVFAATFEELVHLWKNICLAETDEFWVSPKVAHVEPYDEATVNEARRIHNFYMKDLSRQEIEATADLRMKAREANDQSMTSFNQTYVFRKDCDNDAFRTKLFGPTKRPLYPEEDKTVENQRKEPGMPVVYDTFLQRQEKYQNTAQPKLKYDEDCPVPRCHTDKKWHECCRHLITDVSKMRRHIRKNSPVIPGNLDITLGLTLTPNPKELSTPNHNPGPLILLDPP